jgi:hypothetical protein
MVKLSDNTTRRPIALHPNFFQSAVRHADFRVGVTPTGQCPCLVNHGNGLRVDLVSALLHSVRRPGGSHQFIKIIGDILDQFELVSALDDSGEANLTGFSAAFQWLMIERH